jgi:hypothetical protein
VVITAVVLALLAGCSTDRLAARQTIGLLARTTPATEQESDIELVYAATPSGLKQLEGLMLVAGPDPRLIALLTKAFCGYGAGFVQDDWEVAVQRGERERADELRIHGRAMFERCAMYAHRTLGKRFDDVLTVDDDRAAAILKQAGKGDAEALYWLATSVVSTVGMDPSDVAVAMQVPRATAILERVVALDPKLEDGQATMILGALMAAQSAAVGGDPDKGKALLEQAGAVSGGKLLMPRVLMARIYAVTTRDEALFTRLLVDVVRTSPAISPERRLANEIAQRKARRYLAAKKRWF